VILMSDHGFAAYQRSFFADPWLVEQGFAAPSSARATLDPRASANLAEERVLEHRRKLELLDLPRTAAFALACEANYGSIRLNVAGREPSGSIDPAHVDAKLREIEDALLAWRAPGKDERIVTRVFRTADLYPGPYSARLPDLIFELDPSICARSNLAKVAYGEHARVFPDHHLEGIWIAAGPSFAARAERGRVSVFDLAPTALALLRLPVHSEMSGSVLERLFAAPIEVRRMAEADAPAARPSYVEQGESDPEEVKRRLRETGYAE
jgi:predicted AlkP superfamily phosphohydrolase/phosphomutase